jgi:cytochrome c oxidase subunit 2
MSHDALDAAGPFSAAIAEMFWVFVGVSLAVYLIVIGFLVFVLRRRAHSDASSPDGERRAVRAIAAAVAVTSVVLLGLGLSDFFTARVLTADPQDPLRVRVTAHQWWWEIEYLDEQPSRHVRTANELHIPVGRPVQLEMTADDVIHSFWVPSLQGKKDLLPGYTTTLNLVAARPGTYEGNCAEFCGYQHAHMRIDVVAHEPGAFRSWFETQLAAAAEPTTPEALRGRDVFMATTCVMCHAIQGTDANAVTGPDLTHVASRRRIAAGTLENQPANLSAWIRNPQNFKPGSRMPATRLDGEDLAALTTYLSSLK